MKKYVYVFLFFFSYHYSLSQNLLKEINQTIKETEKLKKSINELKEDLSPQKKADTKVSTTTSKTTIESPKNFAEVLSKSDELKFTGGFEITPNIYVKIDGDYPQGYTPKWKIIGNPFDYMLSVFNNDNVITVNFESLFTYKPKIQNLDIFLGITSSGNKSVLNFNVGPCSCTADIDIPKDKFTISTNEITLGLSNFRKYQDKNDLNESSKPCQSSAAQTQGGWKGYIKLKSDGFGNLKFGINLENYASPRYRNGQLAFRYFIDNFESPNLVTTKSAHETKLKKEQDAERLRLRRIEVEKIRKEEEIAFEIMAKNSYTSVRQKQSLYKVLDAKCLKVDKGEKLESRYEEYVEMVEEGTPYDPKTGQYSQLVPRKKGRMVETNVRFEGQRNVCTYSGYILGLKKSITDLGTAYYEDSSIELLPNEITYGILSISVSYNPSISEVNKTYFYKLKLK